jgi:hypothetical protein
LPVARISNTAVRQAIVGHLENDDLVTALVEADRIYGEQVPAKPQWPFIQYGADVDAPLRATCLDGQVIDVAVHSFARGPGAGPAIAIGGVVAASLDGRTFDLTTPYAGKAKVRYTGGRTMRDDADANSWHRVSEFEIRVFT